MCKALMNANSAKNSSVKPHLRNKIPCPRAQEKYAYNSDTKNNLAYHYFHYVRDILKYKILISI